jgi:hypothetical protein
MRAGIALSNFSVHNAVGTGYRISCGGVTGYGIKAQRNGWVSVEVGKTDVWDSRISLVLHCGRPDEYFYALSGTN